MSYKMIMFYAKKILVGLTVACNIQLKNMTGLRFEIVNVKMK
jgi:hypothetical protein